MPTPNYLWSLFTAKCPRCRRGAMFTHPNPWNLKKVLHMHKTCPVCHQRYELEPGFWYGTGYVSYALTVLYLIITFVAWWLTIGMSIDDNRFFWWMGCTVVSLILLQPWFMRLSRVVYLSFFVKYNKHYKSEPTVKLDNS